MRKIRLFIVEDSILMQKVISDLFANESDFEIVGKAYTGKEALEGIPKVKPDIVTLDVHLPDMDGLNVLKEIMEKFPTRVVMLSAYTQKGAEITMKSLEIGALDFIPKPSGEISLDLYNFKEEIISKIKMAAEVDLNRYLKTFKGIFVEEVVSINKIVAIVASTGGPKAVMEVMKRLSPDVPAAFLIVQHMPEGFTRSFAERLSWYSRIKTKEAEDGDLIMQGAGYVAPAGFHMVIEKVAEKGKERFRIRLDDTPLVNYIKPSADVTLSSLAEVFGENTIAVVLTGMGKDGLEGAKKIKEKGGVVIAQDEFSSVVYGMPRAVAEAGVADIVVGLSQIPEEIMKRLK